METDYFVNIASNWSVVLEVNYTVLVFFFLPELGPQSCFITPTPVEKIIQSMDGQRLENTDGRGSGLSAL